MHNPVVIIAIMKLIKRVLTDVGLEKKSTKFSKEKLPVLDVKA